MKKKTALLLKPRLLKFKPFAVVLDLLNRKKRTAKDSNHLRNRSKKSIEKTYTPK